MMASDLVKRLQELIEEHGDCAVEFFGSIPVQSVEHGTYDLRPNEKVILIE